MALAKKNSNFSACSKYKKSCPTGHFTTPAVFNSDQGVQYTSHAWIDILKNHDITISMDGKGRWADNVWIERIWRTVKYECLYLNGVENLAELKLRLKTYVNYYNNRRLHSSLGYKQPARIYQISKDENINNEYLIYCELTENAVIAVKAA